MNRNLELLLKVITWRFFSMFYGFIITYMFTNNVGESAGIVLLAGSTLALLQWGFEIIWDKQIRSKLRHAISRQQGRIGWLVWWRREPRAISVDEHKPRADGDKASTNPLAPENAGREWT